MNELRVVLSLQTPSILFKLRKTSVRSSLPTNIVFIFLNRCRIDLTESVVLPIPTSTSNPAKSTSTSKSKPSSQRRPSTSEGSATTHVNPSSASGLTNINRTSSNNHAHMIVGVAIGVFVGGLAFLGFIAWFVRRRMAKKEAGAQVVSPVEVKIPNASQGDFKDGPRVVVEDYDKDPFHRNNV